MKTITINVSEPVYREFQQHARRQDRTTSELIREAMEEYRRRWTDRRGSVRDIAPVNLGKVLRPISRDDDLLAEMLE
jgi:predicted transcriptional regulator